MLLEARLFNLIKPLLFNSGKSFNLSRTLATAMGSDGTIYGFTAKDSDGADVSMDRYRGKVLIVVNTANECGFANKHYDQLTEILNKYKSKGLEIAAFPCNQFNNQEPGGCSIDIKKAMAEKSKFDPDLYEKIDVNGKNAHPLYEFLKKEQGGILGFDSIKWNFTKFLINKQGKVVKRVAATTEPNSMIPDIEKALNGEL